MPFLQLTFDLGAIDAGVAEGACFAAGAFSVTFSDARDDAVLEPAPGEVRLWPATRVQALFADSEDAAAVARAVAAALEIRPAGLRTQMLADRLWEREWLEHFHAMRFGRRLWVAPRHERLACDAVVVHLDPGLAFGTGTHATTAMCLAWLDEHLASGARVIDYGCGSGILGLAAAKLGAERVECFDIDPQALTATAENADGNGVADRVCIVRRAEALMDEADVLLANILSSTLCALAPRFAELVRPGGRVVLAGLLAREVVEVTRAYDAWFDMRRFGARDDWVGLAGVRSLRTD
ncbi:MAG TPA: 50S ribosomal protein L11 methyltransferase [Steroidobacteraceae bacterium]|nr:50S ribosomal protein L11 methyltransferase [Steroidobacteraceae bacterium]